MYPMTLLSIIFYSNIYINVYCAMKSVVIVKNSIWRHHFLTRNINLGNKVFIIAFAKVYLTLPSSLSQGLDSRSRNKMYCHYRESPTQSMN